MVRRVSILAEIDGKKVASSRKMGDDERQYKACGVHVRSCLLSAWTVVLLLPPNVGSASLTEYFWH